MKHSLMRIAAMVALYAGQLLAADSKNVVMFWPGEENATVKLSFSTFQNMGSYGGTNNYTTQVTSQNLSPKSLRFGEFAVYFLDASGARVCDGYVTLRDVPSQQQVKQNLQVTCVGTPVRLSLTARREPSFGEPGPKRVPLKVTSVPTGASLKVDGQDGGTTPKSVPLTVGTHTLEFSKEGFATGSTQVEIGEDDAPGGSVNFELGGLSQDTVILRDNSVITGDVVSLTMNEIVISVAGQHQKIDRNRVAKIMLVERLTTSPSKSAKK